MIDKTIGVVHAIISLKPGASFALRGETYDDLEWLDEVVEKPTAGEVAAEIARLTVAQVWLNIKAERDRRKACGFRVGTFWFHSDEPSRNQYGILLSVAVEKGLPGAFVFDDRWKTMSGEFVPMTVDLLRQIRDAGLDLERRLFHNAEDHKTAAMASAEPASYEFSTNWPPAYGE